MWQQDVRYHESVAAKCKTLALKAAPGLIVRQSPWVSCLFCSAHAEYTDLSLSLSNMHLFQIKFYFIPRQLNVAFSGFYFLSIYTQRPSYVPVNEDYISP